MKWSWGLYLLFPTRKIYPLDKNHVNTFVNNWIDIWKAKPTPLSDLRINEGWKSILWSTENRHRDTSHCLVYKHTNFLILTNENMNTHKLEVVGLVESPENLYSHEQTAQLHHDLKWFARQNNYTIDYRPMCNWSHGYHLYEYQN